MTAIEKELLNALIELEESVKPPGSSGAKVDLLGLFNKIDQLGAQLGAEADPSLRHYLQKKSYQKARLFLQGRESENQAGPCGHV